MSLAGDTVLIFAGETGTETVTVKRRTNVFDSTHKAYYQQTATTVESATVMRFPQRATLSRDEHGEMQDLVEEFYFKLTSSVAVADLIYRAGETLVYYEVEQVDKFEDHNRVVARRIEGREVK